MDKYIFTIPDAKTATVLVVDCAGGAEHARIVTSEDGTNMQFAGMKAAQQFADENINNPRFLVV